MRRLPALGIFSLGLSFALLASTAHTSEGDLRCYVPGPVSPQDITYDPEEDAFWVTNFLQNLVHKYSPDLTQELESFNPPFSNGGFVTGIAFNTHAQTLFVVDILSGEIVETHKDGSSAGRTLKPDFSSIGLEGFPSLRGLAFDPAGDDGKGSLYGIETTGTLIYEITLEGEFIRWFLHPDDRDRALGGATAPTSDVALIREDGRLVGFYVTGGRGRLDSIRRLDLDGHSLGISVSLDGAGGNVSAILRRPMSCPGEAEPSDSYVAVVESNLRFAVLEGGEPTFREIVEFECETEGREVRMTWRNNQQYDRIEIQRSCEVLATLDGAAESWSFSFPRDGVYELILVAYEGDDITVQPPCKFVIGSGSIQSSVPSGGTTPIDVATDGAGALYMTDARDRLVVIFDVLSRDRDIEAVGSFELHEELLDEDEFISGIAFDRRSPGRLYVLNATAAKVGVHDDVGALLEIFDVALPDLEQDPEAEESDYGFVEGMTFDPSGDGGNGSLWMVETDRDWIYEFDLQGNLLLDYSHPYRLVEVPPTETPYGISSGGIALSAAGDLYLSGGSLRDGRDIHILRVNKKNGQVVPGSVIPTNALSSGSFTLEAIQDDEGLRLLLLEHRGSASRLTELVPNPPPVGTPAFLSARQRGYLEEVELTFVPHGPYESLQVIRDCEPLADLRGDATSYTDLDAKPGPHLYRLVGTREGITSDVAEAFLQVGRGAILDRRFVWPARSPQQIARDPRSGRFYVSVNWPGDERKLFVFDRNLRFLHVHESAVEEPFEIATLAVRAAPGGQRQIYSIAWDLPVELSEVGFQRFFLVVEDLDGHQLSRTQIFPPQPTNGFITFPTGLTWREDTDTFYFLERNSRTFVEMTPEGELLGQFPHPSPPFQNFVFNLGCTFVAERGTLFITGANSQDHDITKVMEMTTTGELTGFEIPLGHLDATITGISTQASDLIAVGTGSRFSEIFRLQALPETLVPFLRGDGDQTGILNLTDALVVLNYLFLEGPVPACEDGADVDDDGIINLTDALVLLNYLFGSGSSTLPFPFPDPDLDPTPDGLSCR